MITHGQRILIIILVPLAVISGLLAVYKIRIRHKEVLEREQAQKDIAAALAGRPKITPPGQAQTETPEPAPAKEEYPEFYSETKIKELRTAERAKLAADMLDFLAGADGTADQRDRAYRTLLNCREAAAVLAYNSLKSQDMRKLYYAVKACADLKDLYLMDVSEGRSFAEAATQVPAAAPPDVKAQLARLLGGYRDALSIARLEKLAADDEDSVKYAALLSLAGAGTLASVPVIAAGLSSPDAAVQAAACRALNAIVTYDVGTEFVSAPDWKSGDLQKDVAKWRQWWRDNKAAYEKRP